MIQLRGLLLNTFLLLLASLTLSANVADSITLPQVEVSANISGGNLKHVAGSISLLTQADMESFNSVLITDQLNSLPGVYMHSGTFNTNRIVIRGIGSRTPYSSNRIKAYLNDIPLTNADGVTTIEDIDLMMLGRVEIMKGPNSALYGSGLGGTIKLTTIESPDKIKANVQTGSFETYKVGISGGYSKNENNLLATVSHLHTNGFRENNKYNRSSGFINGNFLVHKTKLNFTIGTIVMDAQIPSSVNRDMFLNSPGKAAPNWLSAGGFEQSKKVISGITAQHNFSETVSEKLTLFANYSNSFEHRPFNDLSDQSFNYGVRNQLKYSRNNLDFIAGLELFQESYFWETVLDQATQARIKETRKYGNIFSLLEYRTHEKWRFSGALNLNRLSYNYSSFEGGAGSYSYPFILSPRLGINHTLNKQLTFYGSIGHGFSAPSLEETLLAEGEKNTNIKPETGFMSELGFRFTSPDNSLFIDATAYNIAVQNLLVTKRISEETFMGINAGKTRHTGIEVQVLYNILRSNNPIRTLSFQTSFSVGQNVFVDFVDDGNNYNDNTLPGIPAYSVFMSVQWQPMSNFTLNYNHQLQGKQFINDSNTESYDGYSLVNLNGKYQYSISEKVEIHLKAGVNNLLNKSYASMILVNATGFSGALPRYYYPGNPRNWYFSLTFFI